MNDDELVRRFFARTLAKSLWTHEAHLIVCHRAVEEDGPGAALDRLRSAIRAYNTAVGTPNTATSGYHETLTRYFVAAVAAVGDRDRVLTASSTSRRAPLQHWSSPRLFGPRARAEWVEPDGSPFTTAIQRALRAMATETRP